MRDLAKITSINPATGATVTEIDAMMPGDISEAIESAHAAFLQWREASFSDRASALNVVARRLLERIGEYADLMALEMGKPIAQGRAEVEKCARACDYFAERAEKMLRPEPVPTESSRSVVLFRPLGVILAVMPWNFPFWQVLRFAAPALMAGNAAVIKHASNVPGCALALERLFRESGVPESLVRMLFIGSESVDRALEHPRVRAVTVTGSTEAGKAVARKAGSLIKKSVLELGGSDAYVVLEDADLDPAVDSCIEGRLVNSGQSCIAAKRLIVVDAVREPFEALLVERMRRKKVGDPRDPATEIGPLARPDLRDRLHAQVTDSVRRGAHLLLGGKIPRGEGSYYPTTVLTGVGPGMPAYDEELFGPVAAVVPAKDEEDAIRKANDSDFGLGAAVFTRDLARGERIASRSIECGSCFVNDRVASDPLLPFGGVKESGYGRELSRYGILEFVNIKTIVVR